MRIFDIHSHILPAVDDGAKNLETSVRLLEMMKEQGITDVIATPHFDANNDNLDEFVSKVKAAYNKLENEISGKELPNVYIGSEVFYFPGIGKSHGIRALSLCGSDHLLMELPICRIDDIIINDIISLRRELGIIPIIAHIERYSKQHGFKKLLKLFENKTALAQVNTLSVIQKPYCRTVLKLIKKGYVTYVATDAHSVVNRPPLMDSALKEIDTKLGRVCRNQIIRNGCRLFDEIVGETEDMYDEQHA